MAREDIFVSTDWLAERLGAPDIVVVDASWYLPAQGRDGAAEYAVRRIPGAVHFDLDAIKDTNSPLPHMLPSAREFAAAVGALGIGDGMRIVVYDGLGFFAAPRVRWTFKVFGARDVVILDGGFPKWLAEGRPVEEDAPQPRQPRSFTARLDNAAVADADGAGRGGFETGDHAQRRRLAAAGRPDQHHEFPVRDLQIERRDDGDGPEGLGDLLQTDLGHAATPSL